MSDLHTMNDVVNTLREVITQRDLTIKELEVEAELSNKAWDIQRAELERLQEVVNMLAEQEYNTFGTYSGDDPVLYLESELDARIEYAQQHATKEESE